MREMWRGKIHGAYLSGPGKYVIAKVCVVPTISPGQWIIEKIGEAKRYLVGRGMGEKTEMMKVGDV
jgi:hypothetical protein